MTDPASEAAITDRRISVWFGEHKIADYVGAPDDAARYEAGMRRRFLSLRITNESIASAVDSAR